MTSKIRPTVVHMEGVFVRGLGDLHGWCEFRASQSTMATLRWHFRYFDAWQTGWLANDDRVVSAVVDIVMTAAIAILSDEGVTEGWSQETLASIIRRSSRQRLDEIKAEWTLPILIRLFRRYLSDPRTTVDEKPHGRRLLRRLRRDHEAEANRVLRASDE